LGVAHLPFEDLFWVVVQEIFSVLPVDLPERWRRDPGDIERCSVSLRSVCMHVDIALDLCRGVEFVDRVHAKRIHLPTHVGPPRVENQRWEHVFNNVRMPVRFEDRVLFK
jgi:hypothetical protein